MYCTILRGRSISTVRMLTHRIHSLVSQYLSNSFSFHRDTGITGTVVDSVRQPSPCSPRTFRRASLPFFLRFPFPHRAVPLAHLSLDAPVTATLPPTCFPLRHQPAHFAYPSENRRSRYDRDQFALDPHSLRAAALGASSPVPSKQKHQAVPLSAIDIISPTSPVSDAPPLNSSTMTTKPPRPTCTRDQRLKTSPRARTPSPTPSLTSMSACFSNGISTTPLTFDDKEWQVVAETRASATGPEFELADTEGDRIGEDDMSWYARKLGQIVWLSIRAPVRARTQSCFSHFLRPVYPT